MKRTITFLMAASLIFGFAGISMAADDLCAECVAPGIINRACDLEQERCASAPFDYEDQVIFTVPNIDGLQRCDYISNYCDDAGKLNRRVLFPVCNCENFREGDLLDIRMEILVNGESGANGAYWAQEVNGRGIWFDPYVSQTAACDDETPDYDYGSFSAPFRYKYYDEDGDLEFGLPRTAGNRCDELCDFYSDDNNERFRVTIIEPDANALPWLHGYVIDRNIDQRDLSIWAIDVPFIRFDNEVILPGDEISVRICIAKADMDPTSARYGMVDLGGICSTDSCCCTFTVGTLGCCLEATSMGLIYPYATPMNDADWWYGFVITNLTSGDGEAVITVYETDGDTATITVPVAANNMYVKTMSELMTAFGGTIGDARAYFEVTTTFDADGFFFIGDGEQSMGYLPSKHTVSN